jgi:peptidylprolyl isomerase
VRLAPLTALLCLIALVALAGCSEEESGLGKPHEEAAAATEPKPEAPAADRDAASRPAPKVTVPSGPPPAKLEVKDLEKGTGPKVKAGDQLAVNYTGVAYSTHKQFDSSFTRGEPIRFQLGTGMVIPGWDRGLVGARVGARRQLVIPPALAYGSQGSPPDIKPDETLVFVLDVLSRR